MRRRRVAAFAACAALASVLVPSGSASAATSNDCDADRSKKVTQTVLSGELKLWVDSQSPTRTVVCFHFLGDDAPLGGLAVVFDLSASNGDVPVDIAENGTLCTEPVLGGTDPFPYALRVGINTNAVCFTFGDSTVSVQFLPQNVGTGVLNTLEIWRDGGDNYGAIGVAACPAEWLIAVIFGGPNTCRTANARIFPPTLP